MTRWMVSALGYSIARWQATCANSNAERSGVGKGEMAARLRLYSTENIGRATPFVLVIPPCFPPRLGWGAGRTSACSVTGFSSKHTTGSAGSYGFSYISRTSSILAMYSSLSSATVAVGMPVTRHPPHRSVREELPHTALISDG